MRLLNTSTIFIVAGLALGLGSAMQSLEKFGLNSVDNVNGWKQWRMNADDRFQPYALGHFLSNGALPTPISSHYFVRETDDDGHPLRGDCTFFIEGPLNSSRWWSLSVRSEEDSKPGSVLSAGRAILNADKSLKATISLRPMPGNWLQPPGEAAYSLVYVVTEPEKSDGLKLPKVKRGQC